MADVERDRSIARKILSVLGRMPVFCALVPVVWCLCYGFTILEVGSSVGRQSSTSGIAAFLAFIAAPLLAMVGSTLGRLAARILTPAFPSQWALRLKWCSPIVLVVIAVVASREASGPIYAAARAAVPRVILNSAQLYKRTGNLATDSIVRASRVYDSLGKVNKTIPWGNGSVHLTSLDNSLEVRFTLADHALFIPLRGIDYINFVDAIPLKIGAEARPALSLLITGRATGRRDLMAVISESGELVYLELLDRFWDFRSVPLAITPSAAGDLILVGTQPQNLLVFAPRDAARRN